MADFWIKTGDTVPSVVSTLEDANGDPIDIQDADVTFVLRAFDGAAPVVEAAATNLQNGTGSDGSKGKVQYDWQVGQTDVAGGYRGEWRVQFADGRGTVPNSKYLLVAILGSLGASV